MEIKLGQEVQDVISGYKGRVTGLMEYITGCKQALITPRVDEKGEMRDPHYVDVDRLVIMGEAISLPITAPAGPSAPTPPERHS